MANSKIFKKEKNPKKIKIRKQRILDDFEEISESNVRIKNLTKKLKHMY
jgi:hypothetical protein